jgi:hypothetical protein
VATIIETEAASVEQVPREADFSAPGIGGG